MLGFRSHYSGEAELGLVLSTVTGQKVMLTFLPALSLDSLFSPPPQAFSLCLLGWKRFDTSLTALYFCCENNKHACSSLAFYSGKNWLCSPQPHSGSMPTVVLCIGQEGEERLPPDSVSVSSLPLYPDAGFWETQGRPMGCYFSGGKWDIWEEWEQQTVTPDSQHFLGRWHTPIQPQ